MKPILLILALIPAGLQAQNLSLPVWVIDSLLFEAKLSRQCNELQKAQAEEIKTLGLELVATGTALKLSQGKSSTLESLLENSKESQKIEGRQFALDLNTEKKKVKKWRRVAVLQTLGIVVGLLILL